MRIVIRDLNPKILILCLILSIIGNILFHTSRGQSLIVISSIVLRYCKCSSLNIKDNISGFRGGCHTLTLLENNIKLIIIKTMDKYYFAE